MWYIKHFIWFMRTSYDFMAGTSKWEITRRGMPKAHRHAMFMRKWEKLTPEQREAWYLSGEGRTIQF